MKYVLLSFPRSGNHYTQALLKSRLGIDSVPCHRLSEIKEDYDVVISIVRYPLDSFVSAASKEFKNREIPEYLKVSNMFSTFRHTMDQIYNNADIVIDFNELSTDPEKVIEKLASRLNLPISNIGDNIVILDRSGYLATSKNLDNYEQVRAILSQGDISPIIESYERTLSKAI